MAQSFYLKSNWINLFKQLNHMKRQIYLLNLVFNVKSLWSLCRDHQTTWFIAPKFIIYIFDMQHYILQNIITINFLFFLSFSILYNIIQFVVQNIDSNGLIEYIFLDRRTNILQKETCEANSQAPAPALPTRNQLIIFDYCGNFDHFWCKTSNDPISMG